MWRDLLERLDPQAALHPPATLEQLQSVEATLGISLPAELQNLLLETNGAEITYGLELIWSADAILQRNLEMRHAWPLGEWIGTAPINHLLFFGDRGNGDLYFLPIAAEGVKNHVSLWDHENDSRTSSTASLADWLSGKGSEF